MLEDSGVDVQQYLVDKFRETYDLLRDNMVINGTGNNQPTGILQNVGGVYPAPVGPAYVPTKSATGLTGDGFINLGFSLPEQYDTNARMVANKTNTGAAMATLKDGTGRYLWGYGMQDSGLSPGGLGSGARMMCGYPVTWSGFMPNVTANAYPVLFGDFSAYYLINRIGLSIQILSELYAESNYIVILGRLRFGGQLAEEWKLKALKVSLT
jgi:HK97 family phage major capsid protein